MAPVDRPSIGDLNLSSLELDVLSADPTSTLKNLVSRSDALSPLAANAVLTARNVISTYVPGSGSKPASAFNNAGFLALFALLGTAMVIAALWFFFWAKNGGFQSQPGAWDDYKSTVLRRKGPDGKTLSNATKSTRLGGGSVVHGQQYKWEKNIAKSVVGRDEKGRKGIRAKRGFANTHSVLYSDDYQTESFGTETVSDMTEVRTEAGYTNIDNGHSKRYRDRDLAHYKKEKPARVGGLNRAADGSNFAYSDRSDTVTETSEQQQPLVSKHRRDESREQKRDELREQKRDELKQRERAERLAKAEAARMELRWKREAEAAAVALAVENNRPRPPHSAPKKSAAPSTSKPSSHKQRRDTSRSRSNSPQKKSTPARRDFSYQDGGASEVLSTAYTGTSGTRTASYYDEYRPKHSTRESNRDRDSEYSSDTGRSAAGRSRDSRRQGSRSPKKGRREGGYRRGADSDLD